MYSQTQTNEVSLVNNSSLGQILVIFILVIDNWTNPIKLCMLSILLEVFIYFIFI